MQLLMTYMKTITEIQYSVLPTKPAQSQANIELMKSKEHLSQQHHRPQYSF